MNGTPGIPQATTNLQLLTQALFQVSSVRGELQTVLPQALVNGMATVTGDQLQRWISLLQSALDALSRIGVILIFPPPPISGVIGEAQQQIRIALAILQASPVTMTAPSQGVISLQNLQTAISALQQAEMALIRAIQMSV